MSFKSIIKLATERQNEINKVAPTGYPTKFAPPKKETKIKGSESLHVQAALQKIQAIEDQKNLKSKANKLVPSANSSTQKNATLLDDSITAADIDLTHLFTKHDRRVARVDSEDAPNMLQLLQQRNQQRKQQQQQEMQQRDEMERLRREQRLQLTQTITAADTSMTTRRRKQHGIEKDEKGAEMGGDAKLRLQKHSEKKMLEEKKLKRQKAEEEAALRLRLSSGRDAMLRSKILESSIKRPSSSARNSSHHSIKRARIQLDDTLNFKIPKKNPPPAQSLTYDQLLDAATEISKEAKPILEIPIHKNPIIAKVDEKPMTQEEKQRFARQLAEKFKKNKKPVSDDSILPININTNSSTMKIPKTVYNAINKSNTVANINAQNLVESDGKKKKVPTAILR